MANSPSTIPGAAAADNAAKTQNALWYTFTGVGRAYLIRRGSAAASDADASSVHGYNTIEQAYTNPNGVNALSQATISQWNYYASLPAGGGVLGVIETINVTAPTQPGQSPILSTPQNPTTGAIKDALGGFNLANWFLRIGEILLGLVLVGVGIARITGAQNFISQAVQTKMPIPIPV